jgi:hypothetical protein
MYISLHVKYQLFLSDNIYIYIYRVSQEEGTKLREGVPYVKLYRKTPKHLYPKLYRCILRGFKTSDDAFRLSYSITFDCSIRPFLDLFHSWLYIFHLSRFSGDSRLAVEAMDQHSQHLQKCSLAKNHTPKPWNLVRF